MGFFDSTFGNIGKIFGGGNDDAENAAQLLAFQNQKGVNEIRSQFGQTSANLQPFITAGQGGLEGQVQGSTFGGFSDRLNEIFNSPIFNSLRDERTRAGEGQLAGSGLSRSGFGVESIADIPNQLALALEQIISGREGQLAGQGLSSALNLGSFGSNQASNIANIFGNTGGAQASGFLSDQGASQAGTQNLLNTAASAAGLFFSDPNLKENIKIVGNIGPLSICTWDWIPETKGSIVEMCSTKGFMADEVQEFYPEYVHEFGGFDIIDYPGLLDQLELEN